MEAHPISATHLNDVTGMVTPQSADLQAGGGSRLLLIAGFGQQHAAHHLQAADDKTVTFSSHAMASQQQAGS